MRFEIEGPPVPKKRARVGKRGGYTPEATKTYETKVGYAYKNAHPGSTPIVGPVSLEVWVEEEPRPESRQADLDNYVKTVCDGLNGVAWIDDKQVVVIRASIVRGVLEPKLSVWVYDEERGL